MSQSIAGSTEKGTETGNEKKKDENTTEAEAAAPGLRNIISKRNFTTKKIMVCAIHAQACVQQVQNMRHGI